MLRILLVLPVLALLVNLAVLDYSYLQGSQSKKAPPETRAPAPPITPSPELPSPAPVRTTSDAANSCPQTCLNAISQASLSKAPVTATTITNQTISSKGEYVIPLGSGSVTQLNSWTNIDTAQTTIDTANYPAIKTAYFEVVMHIPNASGEVRARLYDISTPYIFDGETLVSQSGTGELLSHTFPIQYGKKTYKVQMFTTISAGTLDSARIRLVTQ